MRKFTLLMAVLCLTLTFGWTKQVCAAEPDNAAESADEDIALAEAVEAAALLENTDADADTEALTEYASDENSETADGTLVDENTDDASDELTSEDEADEADEEDATGGNDEVTLEDASKEAERDTTESEEAAMTEKKTDEASEKADSKKKSSDKVKKEKKASYTKSELKLLACLIYSEAGNQSYKGKLAVANVVLNRVKSSEFPNTIKEVIYHKTYSRSLGRTIYQFSVAYPSVGTLKKALNNYGKRTNAAEIEMEEECIKAAKAALEGKSAIDDKNYLFFCRYRKSLANSKPYGVKIGAHYFY